MGTVFSFVVRSEPSLAVHQALTEAVAWLHRVDEVFSPCRADSQISRLGRGELTVGQCDDEVAEVLDLCRAAGRASGGWFTFTPGGRLDPSAMVKGWAVERASQILCEAGARHHCVNGGGDIQARGEAGPGRPWSIGVAHPLQPGELVTAVSGRDLAVATSGSAERGHHIVDPHSGRPATGLASITLVGRNLTEVDAMATAAFAMGDEAREWIRTLDGIEAFACTADARVWWTPGFAEHGLVPANG
ncbi:FAD:protein FMN transferase [Streptomyces sp. NPDC002730]|uniref:FAD:protein FMN transferase n=1 Tax=Streptomyces sp. NPDC002730 TaxID=3364662 RepID=UPI0036D0DEE7